MANRSALLSSCTSAFCFQGYSETADNLGKKYNENQGMVTSCSVSHDMETLLALKHCTRNDF